MKQAGGARLRDVTVPLFSPGTGCQCVYEYLGASHHANLITGLCYPLLIDCYRGPLSICLDWKEICDGFSDCLAGTDELHSKRNNRDLMDYQYEELIGRRSFSYLCSTIQYFLILGNTDILNLYCRQLLNYFIEHYFGYYINQKTSNNLTYEYLINNCPSE
ncbi:unnamed protein product [Adineta steineri]|uniref:Uncharacterized protein n=1 Tax=Adineta steineri TaxID=433720 RepID=A0A819S7F6_9BILA|nr:unnamed protein product [Adineta steineri]